MIEAVAGLAVDRDAVALAANEAAANAVVHARTPFVVSVAVDASEVRVEVTDASSGRPVPAPIDLDTPGGFGLHLIDRLSAKWGFDAFDGGKVVWFVVPLHGGIAN